MGTEATASTHKNFQERKNDWRLGLLRSMKNPNKIICQDEIVVVIKDSFPKASIHYLVCSKEDIPTLKAVSSKHLKILKHMQKIAEEVTFKFKGKNFLFGYHASPSMIRLHLHVISDDFDSPFLKTKKHWNSFTTSFFIPSERVINELETNGKISHMPLHVCKKLIQLPLKCHKCQYKPKNMTDLKEHLKLHLS